jgi:hypothetical protein
MTDLRISEIAEMTTLSMRYWQKRAAAGDLPQTRVVQLGKRKTFLVNAQAFARWWEAQQKEVKPCQKISVGAGASGGTGSSKMGSLTKGRFKPASSESLKNDLKVSAGS